MCTGRIFRRASTAPVRLGFFKKGDACGVGTARLLFYAMRCRYCRSAQGVPSGASATQLSIASSMLACPVQWPCSAKADLAAPLAPRPLGLRLGETKRPLKCCSLYHLCSNAKSPDSAPKLFGHCTLLQRYGDERDPMWWVAAPLACGIDARPPGRVVGLAHRARPKVPNALACLCGCVAWRGVVRRLRAGSPTTAAGFTDVRARRTRCLLPAQCHRHHAHGEFVSCALGAGCSGDVFLAARGKNGFVAER